MRPGRATLVLLVAAVISAGADQAAGARVPGFVGCRSFFSRSAKALVRPRSIMLACGDGNFYATGLTWSRWDARSAAGAGLGHANDCKPDCAEGHFHVYRVTLRLGGPARCGTRKELQFTRVSWRFPGPKPSVSRSGAETFRCS